MRNAKESDVDKGRGMVEEVVIWMIGKDEMYIANLFSVLLSAVCKEK